MHLVTSDRQVEHGLWQRVQEFPSSLYPGTLHSVQIDPDEQAVHPVLHYVHVPLELLELLGKNPDGQVAPQVFAV